jgi:tetratricopeptide (TPR) repeat protein
VETLESVNVRDSGNIEEIVLFAEALIDAQRMREAEELLRQHWPRVDRMAQARFLRGFIQAYTPQFSYQQCLEDLDTALALEPNHAQARVVLAEVHRRLGNLQRALEELSAVFRTVRISVRAQMTRVELLAEFHRWPEVLRVADQILKLSHANARAISLKGRALLLLGRASEAAHFANQVHDGDAARSAALGIRALANVDLRNYTTALVDADAALALGGRNIDAYMAKARALALLGKWTEATAAAKVAYTKVGHESESLMSDQRNTILGILLAAYEAKHAEKEASTRGEP